LNYFRPTSHAADIDIGGLLPQFLTPKDTASGVVFKQSHLTLIQMDLLTHSEILLVVIVYILYIQQLIPIDTLDALGIHVLYMSNFSLSLKYRL